MARLVSEIQGATFQKSHPVLQAAYAHHALTAVHPFADGNGRVARALASIFLYRASSIPLVVFFDQRDEYYDALAAADGGRFQPFTQFVLDRAMATMTLIASQLTPSPAHYLRILGELLTGERGVTFDELEELALGSLTAIGQELGEQLANLQMPRGVKGEWGKGQNSGRLEGLDAAPYRRVGKSQDVLNLSFQSAAPAAGEWVQIVPLVARSPDVHEPIAFAARNAKLRLLTVRLGDVYPTPSAWFKAQIAAWVRSILADTIAELAVMVRQSLGKPANET